METHSVRLIAESHSLCIPETCTKRQTTQHGRLLSLLGDGDKGIKIVEGRKKVFYTRAAKAEEQKSIVPARQAQRTSQERIPFICPL